MLISLLVTQKFFNDNFYGNTTIAKLGGVDISELNRLEEEFLELLDFHINITSEEYTDALKNIQHSFKQPRSDRLQDVINTVAQALVVRDKKI
jgi:hypothetical protein